MSGSRHLSLTALAVCASALMALMALVGCLRLHGAVSVESAAHHWAFQPPHTVAEPKIRNPRSAGRTPVDRFVVAKLESLGLALNEPAARATLLRRASFILTGLPASPDEIESFLQDRNTDAFERRCEAMLSSPRFGERWGRHWLDVAGYADSNGYFNADTDRPLAYRYRDYVIRSITQDKPFDQFLREQLAGDELTDWMPGQPADDRVLELLEATHFLRNGQDGTGESDGNPDEVKTDRYYALESAMQIIGSSLLGMTVQCAKCHDHKFEPISQKDYYSLQAVLYPAFHIEKWVKPNDRFTHAYKPGELESWQKDDDRLREEETQLEKSFTSWVATHRVRGKIVFSDDFEPPQLSGRWSNTAPGDTAPGGTPPVAVDSEKGPGAVVKAGQLQIVEGGGSGDRWLTTKQSWNWRPAHTGEWIHVTFDLIADHLPGAPGGAERIGYFIATHDFAGKSSGPRGNILVDGHPSGPTSVQLGYPGPGAKSIGSIGKTGYRPGHNYGVRVTRKSESEVSLQQWVDGAEDGDAISFSSADIGEGGFGFEYCCSRSFIVDNVVIETSQADDPAWVERQAAFQKEMAERSAQRQPELKRIRAARRPKPGKISWMTDLVAEVPEVHLLKRGDHRSPGDLVLPAFPTVLNQTSQALKPVRTGRSTGVRRQWAEWLTASNSPQAALLARVTMNRMWQHYFGVGLVSTSDNLGLSGSPPSHPELLDALANEFIRSGWSMKSMHRLMLKSAVFQQSSRPLSKGLAKDPADRLLWRYPIHRLDADAIRDATLAISGHLDLGCTNGPYVPTTRSSSGEVVVDETAKGAFARSIFLQQRRTQAPTLLGLFDAPSIVFNCSRRAETTMPLQSLSLMNSDFSVKRGADFAARLERELGRDSEKRVERAFLWVMGARPSAEQAAIARQFLAKQRAAYGTSDESERQAWNDFCQMLLASNSFLYLE